MNWYLKALKQYFDFKGRARRKEYWMFVLFNLIFVLLAIFIDNFFDLTFKIYGQDLNYGWIYLIYCLAVLIPGLAVCVRRLHDIGRSGWYYFLSLIPIIGGIILIVWTCQDGEPGENEWGANPKE